MKDIWNWGNFYGMVGATGLVTLCFRKRIGWLGSALWFWVLLSAIRTFQLPQNDYGGLALLLNRTTGQAFSQAIVIPLAVLMLPSWAFKHWRTASCFMIGIEALFLLTYGYGLLNANSFDGGWIAAMLSVAPTWLIVPAVMLLSHTRGATAFMVIGAELAVWSQFWKLPFEVPNPKRFKIAMLAPGALLFLIVALIIQGKKLSNDSERIETWVRSFRWWHENHMEAQGVGVGTFQWVGPWLQHFGIGQHTPDLFLQMHSDWLQPIWEGGLILGALMLLFYVSLLWHARGNARTLAALVGTGAFALTYHPLRFFPSAFWIMCAAREALELGQVTIDGEVLAWKPTLWRSLWGSLFRYAARSLQPLSFSWRKASTN